MFHQKCEVFADMMLNTSVICLLKWLSDKFLTISLNILANPCGQLPTVSVMWLYQEGLLGNLPKMPRNPWPFTDKNLDHLPRILTNFWPTLPRNPGPYAESANKFSAIRQDCQGPSAENANKSLAICRDCQECRVFLGWPWLPAHSAA